MSEKIISSKDIVEITAKTALSAIPVGGALISCIWDSVKSNCAQKRLKEWELLLEERLVKIEDTLEQVGSNECFTTAVMKATESAIKTMENEKRNYLANAVFNSLTCEVNESILMMYLGFIDKYTLWHIKILDFFQNPTKFEGISAQNYYMGSPMKPLCSVYQELENNNEVVDLIIKELYADGLMNIEKINCTMTGNGMVASRTTQLGNDFIEFITNK
jgi:hypothetical protein